jgi:hypothetical protein
MGGVTPPHSVQRFVGEPTDQDLAIRHGTLFILEPPQSDGNALTGLEFYFSISYSADPLRLGG